MTFGVIGKEQLLLAHATVRPENAARIEKLGAEVIPGPLSIDGVERVVMDRLEKAQFTRRSLRRGEFDARV